VVELAEILRRFKARFLERLGKGLPFAQRRAMGAIEACRTPRLGGQVYQCPDCQKERYSYHSCKNRHCPKCQGENARQWLERQRALLLPVPYFLLTATLPEQLRPLARKLPKTIYNSMFQSATAALLKLTRDRKYLGGALPGAIAILHTWKRDLLFHPHIHCLVTGGGLTRDGKKWRASNNTYLVNVKACSKIYRAKFRDAIDKAGLADQVDPKVWRKKWVVHVIPVGNGLPALKYLAPYVFRTAITNSRIEKLDGDEVTFRFRDGKTKIWKRCTLKAEEFIRRFLQHVLPKRFIKVRYYGLLSPRNRHLLEKARALLCAKEHAMDRTSSSRDAAAFKQMEMRACRCLQCGAIMMLVNTLAPQNRAPP
jgi:hypothetical protein